MDRKIGSKLAFMVGERDGRRNYAFFSLNGDNGVK